MDNTNIMFLSFGNETRFHLQTYFAILSILRFASNHTTIIVYTDRPELYGRLAQHIEVVSLTKGQIDEWVNGSGYIYRTKILSILDFTRRFPGRNLLFIDCDTVAMQPLDELAAMLNRGKGVMHQIEGHPASMYHSQKRLWKVLKGRTIGGTTISMRHLMWNSGVIGIPAGMIEPIATHALAICDAAIEGNARCLTIEQYAFSVAMQETLEICTANRCIAHYWGNKEQWLAVAANFIQMSHFKGLSLDEEVDVFPSSNLEKLPLQVKQSNTRLRLNKFLSRIFPDRIITK